jgi:hypothetical protein
MIKAIQLLQMHAADLRRMTTPNAHTITEHAAKENEKLADEYEMAAQMLRQMHNKAFEEGILAGVQSLAESCKRRRDRPK